MMMRKLGGSAKPVLTISHNGDKFGIKSETTVKTTEFDFKFGEEFTENTADGRKVQVSSLCIYRETIDMTLK